jgi:hypothetical protein
VSVTASVRSSRQGWPARRARVGRSLGLLALVLAAGCGDLLGAAGLTRLDGLWVGHYDADFDFFLDLDDDLLGLYGTAGIVRGSSASSVYVDGERSGGSVRFYPAESADGERPVFEGTVTGRDRIDGIVYLDVLPHHVTLRRQDETTRVDHRAASHPNPLRAAAHPKRK